MPSMIRTRMWTQGDLRTALYHDLIEDAHEFDWDNKGKQIALDVAQGLHFLHTSGVVHR